MSDTPGTTIDTRTLAGELYQAGLRGEALVRGVAIALLEGGTPGSTANVPNPKPGYLPEYSVGPWGINLLAHGNAITEAQARDPHTAAQFVAQLYHDAGDTFGRDWVDSNAALEGKGDPELVTKAAGAQKAALAAVSGLGTSQTTTPSIGLPNPLDGLQEAGKKISDTLTAVTARGFWPRISLTVVALGLIVGGALVYFRRDVEQAATTAASVAKAAA